jgi:hypothetical protein
VRLRKKIANSLAWEIEQAIGPEQRATLFHFIAATTGLTTLLLIALLFRNLLGFYGWFLGVPLGIVLGFVVMVVTFRLVITVMMRVARWLEGDGEQTQDSAQNS